MSEHSVELPGKPAKADDSTQQSWLEAAKKGDTKRITSFLRETTEEDRAQILLTAIQNNQREFVLEFCQKLTDHHILPILPQAKLLIETALKNWETQQTDSIMVEILLDSAYIDIEGAARHDSIDRLKNLLDVFNDKALWQKLLPILRNKDNFYLWNLSASLIDSLSPPRIGGVSRSDILYALLNSIKHETILSFIKANDSLLMALQNQVAENLFNHTAHRIAQPLEWLEFALSELDISIDVNFQEEESGNTPLINAARMGRAKLVKLLLEKRADPLKKTKTDKTALDYVQEALRDPQFNKGPDAYDRYSLISTLLKAAMPPSTPDIMPVVTAPSSRPNPRVLSIDRKAARRAPKSRLPILLPARANKPAAPKPALAAVGSPPDIMPVVTAPSSRPTAPVLSIDTKAAAPSPKVSTSHFFASSSEQLAAAKPVLVAVGSPPDIMPAPGLDATTLPEPPPSAPPPKTPTSTSSFFGTPVAEDHPSEGTLTSSFPSNAPG